MGILWALAPFLAFAAIERLAGPTVGLAAGAVVAAGLLLRDILHGRTAKVLEIGTALLFGALALYAVLARPTWSVIGVRLVVDAGLLLIVLASMLMRRPFTLQYASEDLPAERRHAPGFIRTNYVVTAAWALAFAVMVAAELALLTLPGLPPQLGIAAIVAALLGAIRFTRWYPDHVRTSAAP